jgi:rhamnosyltransferase
VPIAEVLSGKEAPGLPVGHLDVVVRCRDEMPRAEAALAALAAQWGCTARVLFIDCGSIDGSREAAVRAGCRVVDWDRDAYRPGEVLNRGMELTTSDVVAFVNADAIALGSHALRALVDPFRDPWLAASYARQVARPDADARTKADYERAFPASGELTTRFSPFFSMAASAIRRSAWRRLPFDASLRYSEDVDWACRVRALGYGVAYASEAEFEKSRDYGLRGHFRRRRGEGTGDRLIHHLGPPSLMRDLARPLAGSVVRDAQALILSPSGLATRVFQAAGYYVGRRSTEWS